MVPFLTQFIDKVLATDVPMHDTAIILPNRRARRKIQQDLLERNGNVPMFAPHLFTMEAFVGWIRFPSCSVSILRPAITGATVLSCMASSLGAAFSLRISAIWTCKCKMSRIA